MSTTLSDFENLLREALAPVEPPENLFSRLETRLVDLTEFAQEELESWELSSMRDPRNWARPVAAAAIGTGAGAGLIALRVRSRHRARRQQSGSFVQLAERTLQDIAEEARRVLPDR